MRLRPRCNRRFGPHICDQAAGHEALTPCSCWVPGGLGRLTLTEVQWPTAQWMARGAAS